MASQHAGGQQAANLLGAGRVLAVRAGPRPGWRGLDRDVVSGAAPVVSALLARPGPAPPGDAARRLRRRARRVLPGRGRRARPGPALGRPVVAGDAADAARRGRRTGHRDGDRPPAAPRRRPARARHRGPGPGPRGVRARRRRRAAAGPGQCLRPRNRTPSPGRRLAAAPAPHVAPGRRERGPLDGPRGHAGHRRGRPDLERRRRRGGACRPAPSPPPASPCPP